MSPSRHLSPTDAAVIRPQLRLRACLSCWGGNDSSPAQRAGDIGGGTWLCVRHTRRAYRPDLKKPSSLAVIEQVALFKEGKRSITQDLSPLSEALKTGCQSLIFMPSMHHQHIYY